MGRLTGAVVATCCLAIASVAAVGCADGDEHDDERAAVPLPRAYPRLPLPEGDSMVTVGLTPIPVRVNAAATTSFTDGQTPALTVRYPALNASVYWTFIPYIGNPDQIIGRRRERISLNLGGTAANTAHTIENSPAEAVLVTATAGSTIPVQLLAVTSDYVVSATAVLDDARAANAYDSIRPLIDLLDRDMRRALDVAKF